MTDIVGFLVCAIIIFFAGKKLSWYGNLIAEKKGWGKAWIGLILLATVTSLPELIVGISSSAIIESADLAVGDIIGSCTFNLAILAVLDIFIPKKQHLFFIASGRHVLSASLSLILIALTGLAIFLPEQIVILPGIGLFSVAFLVIYILSVRLIYRFESISKIAETAANEPSKNLSSFPKLVAFYILFAVITVGAAGFIPYFGERIATQTGLGNSFVGTIFIAASTSLPEIAVSIAAVRFGSVDLAIGNLLGSNIFNILILVVDDAFYTKGILLKDASDANLISIFSCIVMTAIAIAGFTYRYPKKRFLMAIDAFLIISFYFLNLILLYYLRGV